MRLLKLVNVEFIKLLPTGDALHGVEGSMLRHAVSLLMTQDVVRVVFEITTVGNISGLSNGRSKIEASCSGFVVSAREQVKTTRVVVVRGHNAIQIWESIGFWRPP